VSGQSARGVHANKNSRKSRNGLGRGLPKKGGGGGKGTWGKLGCELELPWVDPKDPNYESDGDENIVNDAPAHVPTKNGGQPHGQNGNIKSHAHGTTLKTMVPEMSEEDVNRAVEPLILEYFENNDASEVLYTLQEMLMNLGPRRWMVVSILVELAMDHKPSHREMASVLISELYLKVISQRDIGKAFDYLLRQLPDLVLDTPDACEALGNFLARAIADDCIPPKFLHSYKGHPDNTAESKAALQKADTLLSMKHGLVRLDNVWGIGGGVRPVKYLVKKIVLLLKEYLCSGDIKEATRCLQELEVPHFHHELVYEAVVMVIESMHEKTDEAMCKLLQALFRSFVITIDQMKNGFERVYDFMPEIAIDVPAAYNVLERYVTRCRKAGLITDELLRKMPTRGRKRFVSEGDGGRIKDNWW
jgi:programmed cell death protein 4